MVKFRKIIGVGIFLASTSLSSVSYAQDAWSGLYAGGFVGGGSLTATPYFGSFQNPDVTLSGGLLGLDVGFNTQMNNIVFGLEGDLALSNATGNAGSYNLNMNSLGTLRARAGVAFGENDNTLAYLTGGLAVGNFSRTGSLTGSATHTGFVVGVGAEHKVSESVSIKAEVDYLSLGTQGYNKPGERIKISGVTAKLGVNFHF